LVPILPTTLYLVWFPKAALVAVLAPLAANPAASPPHVPAAPLRAKGQLR
jgi:hypothetical protein